ncbi:complement receptor type 2-like isoform X2 [Megalops cyprinoides]|uniref:complement receptor type 2-like isoform X2 n=1 Tax=Megalops cyprinoides TaxID=118141 RepID=UPI001863F4FB|nr:complement receptor type 2-like isoform X2 [Megalops cyprinoides]
MMCRFEVACKRLWRLWQLVFLGLIVAVLNSHACPKPQVSNSNVLPPTPLQDEYPEGVTLEYECEPGYRKQGSSSITCTGGKWTSLELTCQKLSCPPLPELPNGKYNPPDVTLFGTRVTVTCNKGYELEGRISETQCLATGHWSLERFVCDAVKCPAPPNVPNSDHIPSDVESMNYLDSVRYTCRRPYVLIGESLIVCRENKTYYPPAPECKVVSCDTPNVEFGTRVEGGAPPYGYRSFVVYKCNEGYEMKGSSKIVCEVSGWSPDVPSCHKSSAPCTGPLCSGIFSAVAQRVLIALLIPVGLHLSL